MDRAGAQAKRIAFMLRSAICGIYRVRRLRFASIHPLCTYIDDDAIMDWRCKEKKTVKVYRLLDWPVARLHSRNALSDF